jgi:environmental stress-induced protein Ves
MNLSAQRLIRRADYRLMPWRNGAGTTLEIAREPPTGDEFEWRLSLATIARSGPFSSYPGYERSVTLVEGQGFSLDISEERSRVLANMCATTLFPGAAATACLLIDGECTDLSLMVRAPGRILAVTPQVLIGSDEFTLEPARQHALFCIDGRAQLQVSEPGETAEPITVPFQLHDCWLVKTEASALTLRTSAKHPPATLMQLSWRTTARPS